MVTPAKTFELRPPKAPNLPIAPVQYTQQYQDQVLNALRLYFNQIDNLGQGLTGGLGGSFLYFPFIAAYYYPDQYASADNTATQVLWNGNSGISGFTLNTDNTATASQSGTYKITYSLQFANTDSQIQEATVWLRKNGTAVTGTGSKYAVTAKHGSVDGYLIAVANFFVDVAAGDYIELMWSAANYASSGGALGVWIYSRAAQTSPMAYPATPSALGSIIDRKSVV